MNTGPAETCPVVVFAKQICPPERYISTCWPENAAASVTL